MVDPDWPDEVLYDTSTPRLREQVAELVGRDLDLCAEKGFHGVDLDNLDSYTRSRGLLDARTARRSRTCSFRGARPRPRRRAEERGRAHGAVPRRLRLRGRRGVRPVRRVRRLDRRVRRPGLRGRVHRRPGRPVRRGLRALGRPARAGAARPRPAARRRGRARRAPLPVSRCGRGSGAWTGISPTSSTRVPTRATGRRPGDAPVDRPPGTGAAQLDAVVAVPGLAGDRVRTARRPARQRW